MRGEITRRSFLHLAAGTAAALGAGRAAWAQASPYPPAKAVTQGPNHHFFGYYDKTPWNATGSFLLAMETDFVGRNPESGEELTVGMVDLENGSRYIPLDTTKAWCWQQGTMLQWLGSAPDREVIYNVIRDGRYASVVRDVFTGQMRPLPLPIYSLSRDGRQAVSLDFDRVDRLRPGYGYGTLPERRAGAAAPKDAGLYWMDVKTGENKQILSLEWAAGFKMKDTPADAHHWFNHLEFNPSGTRFSFLHRWRRGTGPWGTRFFTARPDGSDVRLLSDIGMVSHYDWRDDKTILAWTKTNEKGAHFYLLDDEGGLPVPEGEKALVTDGHCSYSPDRKWVLNDTYPDKENKQTLMLYRPADGKRVDLGRFFMPPEWRHKPWRCDLHPRWNRDGTQVCFDGSFEATRQVYVVDVSEITKG